MPKLSAKDIWDHHPWPNNPCDVSRFGNQCAIRMGVALAGAGANLSSFTGSKCYPNLKHDPKHILRVQELADWLITHPALVGAV
jgi:hypothetical protein